MTAAAVEFRSVSKSFGSVRALSDVSATLPRGKVSCVLGDNGAGKSTLISILAGVFPPDGGQMMIDGVARRLENPQDALRHGIATVFQDLAIVPTLAIWRSFVVGAEPLRGLRFPKVIDEKAARRACVQAVSQLGVNLTDLDVPVSALSGGQRQAVAIGRAIHLGARILILDEPTAALGVRQVGIVLRNIVRARDLGVTVVLVTHNPSHAAMVGDHFVLLKAGREAREVESTEISRDELLREMGGTGEELSSIEREIHAED